MIGLVNPQAGPLDEATRRRMALSDALIRQGHETFGSGAVGGFMPIGTIETAGSKPTIAPPLATGVPQSMVRAAMPQPVRGGF
jgi:TctA family transporter